MPIINQTVKGGGTTPTGTISITSNGTHDVTNYASADVQVPTAAPALYREFQLDGTGVLFTNTTTTHIMDFTGMTDISEYMLTRAYNQNRSISGAVDMSDLTAVSGQYACYYMFSDCTGLTSADLSALTTVSAQYACCYMFGACAGLTSVNLSALTTVSGNRACNGMFEGCYRLTSANLPSLTTVSGNYGCSAMFLNCTGLTTANLPSLTTVTATSSFASMFSGCTSLTTVYIGGTTAINFGTKTGHFSNMFLDCTQNIDVYAPAANQTQIESFSGYPNFGGTGNVVWHWRS